MQILSHLVQCLLVIGLSFVVLTMITSFYRFQNLAHQASEEDKAIGPYDVFQAQIANRLGTAHREPEPFLVMVLVPDHLPPPTGHAEDQTQVELLVGIEQSLRKMLRQTDTVVSIGGGRIGVVVDAERNDAESIVRRFLDGICKEPIVRSSGQTMNTSVCAGIATHPENGNRVKTLVQNATVSLEAAQRKGRQQFVLMAVEETLRPAQSTPGPRGVGEGQYPAVVDPLTGVLRPEQLSVALQKYVAQYRKREDAVSILALEVDHFERYREHYGSAAVDAILQRLGAFLQSAVRESDLVGRSGEKAFMIAIRCAPRDAMAAAQRIIRAVKKIVFPTGGGNLHITLSLGVAGYPDHGGHPRKLMEAATAALQTAKAMGHSLCLMYEPSMRMSKKRSEPVDVF